MRVCRNLIVVLGAATLLALSACSKTVAFQGQSTLAIAGTPPAPPPPPPAPPPPPPPRVVVTDNQIEIHEKIQFDDDKATIKPVSFDLLNEIGSVIQKNPQIKKIRIEGYASSEGNAKHNKKLSDDRAKSVRKYLVEHGVSDGELVGQGFGIENPIGDNTTEDGREQNRRVEFHILAQDVTKKKVEVDSTGTEKVLKEKTTTVADPDPVGSDGSKPMTKPAKGSK